MDTEEVDQTARQEAITANCITVLDDDRYTDLVSIYVGFAEDAILNRLFPMHKGKTWADVPTKYDTKAIQVAVYLISKRGAEGETSHEENGTKRSYEAADIPESMLKDIIPFVSVPA